MTGPPQNALWRRDHAALFAAQRGTWRTPADLYAALDAEFHFDFDPCPILDQHIWDGRSVSWAGKRVYCNPPYGRHIASWLAKAREAELAVFLLPSRTDTAWFHDYALRADEIRFVRGRLTFALPPGVPDGGPAPFPSMILVYRAGV